MKARVLSESHARRSWQRLLELQQRGYEFYIKRRGRIVARLARPRPTIAEKPK